MRRKSKFVYDGRFTSESENEFYSPLPKPPPLTRTDRIIALLLGVSVAVFAYIFMFRGGLHPSVWDDCAVAAGLRPPRTITLGLWRIFAKPVFSLLGPGKGMLLVAIGGKIALGAVTAVVYLTFRSILCLVVRKLPVHGLWNRKLAPASAATAALLFAFSDPVWSVFQAFGQQAMIATLSFAAIATWVRFFHLGRMRYAYLALVLSGLLVSETPLGIVILVAVFFVYSRMYRYGYLVQVELVDRLVRQNAQWSLTTCFAFGVVLGIALNVGGYILCGGMQANGVNIGSIPVNIGIEYFELTTSAATSSGWIVGLGMVIVPFLVAFSLICRATDVEHYLKYQTGIIMFVIACVSYSQVTSLYPLWFWTWMKSAPMVSSPVLLAALSFMSSAAILCSLAVMGVDMCCRDNIGLSHKKDLYDTSSRLNFKDRPGFRLAVLVSILSLAVLFTLPGRIQPRTVAMLEAMREYVREVVDDAGDAKWLFTDGSYDSAFELESASRGRRIACVNLRRNAHRTELYAVKKTLLDSEDRLSISMGGSNLLSTWERDKPARIEESAMQLCLELWRRSGKAYPPVAGTLARAPGKMSPEEISASVARVSALAARILAIHAAGSGRYAGLKVNELFLFMQWRIARLARIRAQICDAMGDRGSAIREGEMANALDDANPSLKIILDAMSRVRELTMRQMTPREGLQFALVRADFQLARRYAEPVLDADPDEPGANFGMGMSFFEEGQYSRAEEYLTRCLKRNPNEPAVWNNIAVIQLRTGRLEEAKANAEKALSLIPDSIEVKDTLAKINSEIAVRVTAVDAGPQKDAGNGTQENGATEGANEPRQ